MARQHILVAASRRFSSAPYARVGLREIAEDAGIDVAHVHRAFESNENFFGEMLRTQAGNDLDADPENSPQR